ncbi:MAG: hypothetical protein IT288_05650 [Bdellovibrionales bacterium]|nr:hypothetical protein [Bdellovibrionales bacterium]
MKKASEILVVLFLIAASSILFIYNRPSVEFAKMGRPTFHTIDNMQEVTPEIAREYLASGTQFSDNQTRQLVGIKLGLDKHQEKEIRDTKKACEDIQKTNAEIKTMLADEIKARKDAEARANDAEIVAKEKEKKKTGWMIGLTFLAGLILVIFQIRKINLDDVPLHIKKADIHILIAQTLGAFLLMLAQALL